jgi:hypothetical protein
VGVQALLNLSSLVAKPQWYKKQVALEKCDGHVEGILSMAAVAVVATAGEE